MNTERLNFFNEDENRAWHEMRGRILPSGAQKLYEFARQSDPRGVAVELGTFAGKSTLCIARGLQSAKAARRFVAIDLRFQPDFAENLRAFGANDRIECWEKSSLAAADIWREPISFLYIDAHHGRAHALADLIAWDQFVIVGGIVALDDTLGFMLGPSLQLQAALARSAYDLEAEVGGITFLRKRKNILPAIGEFPLERGSLFAYVQYVSTWLGAMNLDLAAPQRTKLPPPIQPHGKLRRAISGLFAKKNRRDDARTERRDEKLDPLDECARILQWLAAQPLDEWAAPTLTYLKAHLDLKLRQVSAARQKFAALSKLTPSVEFLHYKIDIREMAGLRLAQCLDLLGERAQAVQQYALLSQENARPEIQQAAQRFMNAPFALQKTRQGRLLREYALDLANYRRVDRS